MKSIVVSSLLSLGLLASAQAITIKWQGVDASGVKLSTVDGAFTTSNYSTTALNYTYVATNESFLAYCIEPGQGNGRAGDWPQGACVQHFAVACPARRLID